MLAEILTLVSPALGGLVRLFPTVLDFFHKGQDNAHELAMLGKQIELAKLQGAQKAAEIALQGDEARKTLAAQTDSTAEISAAQGLLDAIKLQGQLTGVGWLDAVNQSVRPVLTYWWCMVLYTVAKFLGVANAWSLDKELAPLLVTGFDQAVIGSMLGFWFVDRSLRKLGR
jgi:hypothetical protein